MGEQSYKNKLDIVVKNKGKGVMEINCFFNGQQASPSDITCAPGEQIIISRTAESDMPLLWETSLNLDQSGDSKSIVKMSYKTRYN